MTAIAHQTGTQAPVVVINTIDEDRHDAEGQRNVRRPSVESAKDDIQYLWQDLSTGTLF